MSTHPSLETVYNKLLERYGPQHWWPGDSHFEVMVGAVLTQATAWRNVEMAIAGLKAVDALSPKAIRRLPAPTLAGLIRPAGFHNAKARKLKALADFLGDRFDDDPSAMSSADPTTLREELLCVHGIGPETADAILLYVAGHPSFVIDAYTRRVFGRLGTAPGSGSYEAYRAMFLERLPPDPDLYGEYHALIVRHGRSTCTTLPQCDRCCLLDLCPTGRAIGADIGSDIPLPPRTVR